MKFFNAKEVRIIMLILASAYMWMIVSCVHQSRGTKERFPASIDESLSGRLKNKVWMYKTARAHKVLAENDSYITLEFFDKDVPQNQLCKTEFPATMTKITIQVPMKNETVDSRSVWVPMTEDADISTSQRSVSSQEYYYKLILEKGEINEAARNNINGALTMEDGHGTRLDGTFTAQLCP